MSTPPNPYVSQQAAMQAWRLSQPVPMMVGSAVSRTLELLRKHFRIFLGLGVLPLVVQLVLMIPLLGVIALELAGHRGEPVILPVTWAVIALLFLLMIAGSLYVYALAEAAVSWAALRVDAEVEATAAQAWQIAWQQPGRCFGLLLLRALRYGGPTFLAMVPMIAASVGMAAKQGEEPSPLAVVLILISIFLVLGGTAVGMIFYVMDTLATAASVTENLSPWQAIQRSVTMTRGSRWRIFGVGFLLYLLMTVAVFVLEFVSAILAAMGVGIFALSQENPVVAAILIVLGVLIFLPLLAVFSGLSLTLQPIYQAILYRDLCRVEQIRANIVQAPPQPGTGFLGPQFR